MSPATDPGRAAEEAMLAQEALALRDELMAYAAQLIRMSTQAGLGGQDLSVRVKEPEHLAHLITRAASAIQARKWAAAEQEAATLRARLQEAEKTDDFWREVLEGSSARWREAAQMALNGDPRRLQRLLSASRNPIVGSSTQQEAGDGR